jgi:hypothetical protein
MKIHIKILGICVIFPWTITFEMLSSYFALSKVESHIGCFSYRTIDTAGSSSEAEPQALLDFAKSRYGGSFHDSDVEEVRSLGKTMLIFFTMIPYWIGYYQVSMNNSHSVKNRTSGIFLRPTLCNYLIFLVWAQDTFAKFLD